MKHYAIDGRYYGYFETEPDGATEVPARPLVDDATWSGTAWVLPVQLDENGVNVAPWIAEFQASIDADADSRLGVVVTRYPLITAALGRLEAEARRCLSAGGLPVPADYPWLSAKLASGKYGGALVDVAQTIVAMGHAMDMAGAAIEQVREATKDAIAACITDDDLAPLQPHRIVWPA